MPKILNFFTNKGPIIIELFDNKFVDFWLDHFLSLQSKYSLKLKMAASLHIREKNYDNIDTIIDRILSTIDKINSLDYIVPMPESITKDQLLLLDIRTQEILNRLHRYLVVATEFRNRWIFDQPAQFPFVAYSNANFMYLLNLVNQSIHALEGYVTTDHKHKFHRIISCYEILVSGSKYQDVDIYADNVDKKIPDDMTEYLRLGGADVWIKKDILGKDFITAFADHDDPTQFDVRPPPMISGGLMIDVDDSRDKLFQSSEFRNWLGSTPTDTHGNYPIGNVVSDKKYLHKCKKIWFDSLVTK